MVLCNFHMETLEALIIINQIKPKKLVLLYLAKMAGVNGVLVPCKPNPISPNKLYELCLTNLVNYLQKAKCDRHMLRTLPDNVLMDVYIKVSATDSLIKTECRTRLRLLLFSVLVCDKYYLSCDVIV